MPYIADEDRFRAAYEPRTPGELNYSITMLFQWYLKEQGLNYTHLNDCVGAAASAVAEFQRRVVAPYEDKKMKENGDVYYLGNAKWEINPEWEKAEYAVLGTDDHGISISAGTVGLSESIGE